MYERVYINHQKLYRPVVKKLPVREYYSTASEAEARSRVLYAELYGNVPPNKQSDLSDPQIGELV